MVSNKQNNSPLQSKFAPDEVAGRWGVTVEKVITWIRSGELRAINVAAKPNGKPRYRIDEADLAAFENRRAVVAAPKTHKKRSKSNSDVIEFF
jgi:predicted site-specific integrase-resolvase